MPPSGHSHSSHSSSHSSHSSHSSSSHSSHSHSSHSGSSHSSSCDSRNNSYTVSHRTRTNQPKGWNKSTHGETIVYYLYDHDYVYYPHDWIDEDGKAYKRGYYDENGIYYTNIAAPGIKTILTCEYCGTQIDYKWKEEDSILSCSNCGATLRIDHIDAKPTTKNHNNQPKSFNKILLIILLSIFFINFCPICCCGFAAIMGNLTETSYQEVHKVPPSTVYVEETGRTCTLDGEDYYDSETECWFYYNEELSPAQWQYWYEGISSNYGDYGWMEFDDNNELWYIETSKNNWEVLDYNSYNTSKLWRFENAYNNNLY